MKANEIRDMTADEIVARISDLTHELFNLRFQHATGQLENPMRLKSAKRDIARLKTLLRESQGAGA